MSTGNYERDVRGLGGQARYHAGPYGQRFFDPQEYFPGPGGSRSHGLGDPPGAVCVADTEVLPWGTFVDATYTTRSRIPPYRTRPVTIYDQPVESIMALSLPRGGGLFGGSPISELISRMPAGVTGLMLKQALAIGELGRYAPSSRAGWRSGVGFRVIGGQDITDVCVRRSATVGLGLGGIGGPCLSNRTILPWGSYVSGTYSRRQRSRRSVVERTGFNDLRIETLVQIVQPRDYVAIRSRHNAGLSVGALKLVIMGGENAQLHPEEGPGPSRGRWEIVGDICISQSSDPVFGLGLTPPGSRPYENPSVWGDALARVTSAAAELALAVKGQRPPPPPDAATDFSTPPLPEESFFSTPAGYVAIGGGVLAVGLIAYFALKKDKPAPVAAPAAAVKAANRRRNRRRNGHYEFYWDVQGNYGHGWETVTAESTWSEARARVREYRENEPGTPLRVVRRRTHVK